VAKIETRVIFTLAFASLVALTAGTLQRDWGLVLGGLAFGLAASSGPISDWLTVGMKRPNTARAKNRTASPQR